MVDRRSVVIVRDFGHEQLSSYCYGLSNDGA